MILSKEIGSEFWNVPIVENTKDLFDNSFQWFISGRSALKAIISELSNCKTVAMPSWCCDSMIKPFIESGFDINFYPVFFNNGLIQEPNFDSDILFLIDYFGYTASKIDLSSYKGIIIRDVTHSFFSKSYSDADYYFGSLRKWCGFWTGGFAWTKDGHNLKNSYICNNDYISLRAQAMKQKSEYIEGTRTDKNYLKLFEEAEKNLENVNIMRAADRDISLIKRLDIDYIKNRRRKNAEILMSSFPELLMFHESSSTDTPMFVPIIINDNKRDELRRYLIEHEIYCPVHWPVSKYHVLNEKTNYIFKNELSLVCDQRYKENDMNRMVETIKAYMEA